MSDRVCVRGCTQRDVHYATCERSGPGWEDLPNRCRGCAPRECRDGSLICDRCFGRMRGLLGDARDLLARLRSIGDPTKATAYDDVKVGRAPSAAAPSAPIGDDLLDAIRAVETAVPWASEDLTPLSNDLDAITWLGALLLDRHAPLEDGTRTAWSVQDAVDRWGVERKPKPGEVFEDDDERAELTEPVPEWGDPIVGRADAERIAGSPRTLSRWVKNGDVASVGRTWIAGDLTILYRTSELLAVRDGKQARQSSGQYKPRTDGERI